MRTLQTPSHTTLHRLRLSASNAYLIIGDGAVLVDSGLRGEGRRILGALGGKGLSPGELKLILLTHGHIDHAGGAREIAAQTGAPIAMHAEDARWVSSGLEVPAPPITRWARSISRLLSVRMIRARMAIVPFTPAIVLGDADFDLGEFGIPAVVVHTPGHTAGSVSVLLEDGTAIVGDLAMNGLPSLQFSPGPPIVAQDLDKLSWSWQEVCSRGATTVYPGHGAPFHSRSFRIMA